MKHEAQFPAVRSSATHARRFVSDSVANVPDDISDTLALIASELATNCVRHAAASAFAIRIEQLPDRVRIEVEDDGGGEPIVQFPDARQTSGRGLQIVEALADEWGVIPKGPAGKTVWATIALPGAGDPRPGLRRDVDVGGDARRRGTGRGPGRPGTGGRLLPVWASPAAVTAPCLSTGTRRARCRRADPRPADAQPDGSLRSAVPAP